MLNLLKLLFHNLKFAKKPKTADSFKHNFLLFRYNYRSLSNIYGVNLGDYVQTIATKYVIEQIYDDIRFSFWDRDDLSNYKGVPAFTIMQGWFSHSDDFLPNKNILPVFIGTHITNPKRKIFAKKINRKYKYLQKLTFGCRDISTAEFMHELGLNAYFSRCLTLALPRREQKNTQKKVYIVDIPENLLSAIPSDLRKNATYITQRQVDCNLKTSDYINTEEKYLRRASALLQEYSDNASLIITSALHCASPCVAMGIPTVLINLTDKNYRFGSLAGILKIYTNE